jgi:hypothetical protein
MMRLGQREVDRTLEFAPLTNTRRGFLQTNEATPGVHGGEDGFVSLRRRRPQHHPYLCSLFHLILR